MYVFEHIKHVNQTKSKSGTIIKELKECIP